MNDIDEKRNKEKINFAMQGSQESAQITIAIAVGVFGILTLFFMIHEQVWTKSHWTMIYLLIYRIILSVAYWALVLFGFQSYLTRQLFEGLIGYYQKSAHEEWYDDIKKIAGENRLTDIMVKKIWASNYDKNSRYKGIWMVMIPYFAITSLLWIFAFLLSLEQPDAKSIDSNK